MYLSHKLYLSHELTLQNHEFVQDDVLFVTLTRATHM